jgi:PAS domain S-box-containing protein
MTIRLKITLTFAVIVSLIALFISLYFPRYFTEREIEALAVRGHSIATMTAFSISPALLFNDHEAIAEGIEPTKLNSDVVYLAVYDISNRILYTYDETPQSAPREKYDVNRITGSTIYYIEVPIESQFGDIGELHVGFSMVDLYEAISEIQRTVFIFSGIVFLLGVVAAFWLGRIITKPLEDVVSTAMEISDGALTKRVDDASARRDEVGMLARSFNLMVDKLNSSYTTLENLNLDLEARIEKRTVELRDEITQRKRIEEELRKLSRAVEQSSVSIVITDLEGKIEYVNPKFIEVTGYSFDDVKGKTPRVIKSNTTPPSVHKELWDTIRSGKEWRGELQNRKKNGELYWDNALISPIRDSRGMTTHYLSVNENITLKKQLEHDLRQAQKLDSIGTLAGGIAHDFNNILGIILGYVTTLSEVREGPEFDRRIHIISRAVDRGVSIVRQILTFARKTEVRNELLQVNTVITELIGFLQSTMPKTVSITSDLNDSLPMILIDSTQLHQALLNLCINARDAISDNGTIMITTSLVNGESIKTRFANAREAYYVQIAVSDTGSGIDEAVIDRIFEPFFTTKGVGKGTGLGLAVVYGIVDAHEGFIDVQSKVGAGTTFVLYLPVQHEGTDAETFPIVKQAKEMGELEGKETVLIVEDEEPLRDMLSTVLTSYGYSVFSATDGHEGLSVFRENASNIDIVVTDVGLPRLDGVSMIKGMRSSNPDLRVIACSGYIGRDLSKSLSNITVDKIIPKPYTAGQILESIRTVLNKEKS